MGPGFQNPCQHDLGILLHISECLLWRPDRCDINNNATAKQSVVRRRGNLTEAGAWRLGGLPRAAALGVQGPCNLRCNHQHQPHCPTAFHSFGCSLGNFQLTMGPRRNSGGQALQVKADKLKEHSVKTQKLADRLMLEAVINDDPVSCGGPLGHRPQHWQLSPHRFVAPEGLSRPPTRATS